MSSMGNPLMPLIDSKYPSIRHKNERENWLVAFSRTAGAAAFNANAFSSKWHLMKPCPIVAPIVMPRPRPVCSPLRERRRIWRLKKSSSGGDLTNPHGRLSFVFSMRNSTASPGWIKQRSVWYEHMSSVTVDTPSPKLVISPS